MREILVLDTYRPDNFRRLHDWFGIWSIYEPAAMGLANNLGQLDIPRHVAETQAAVAGAGRESDRTRYSLVDGIALIDVSGTMMKYASSFGDGASTVHVRKAIRAAANDPAVKAILMVYDTPGGTVSGTPDLAGDLAIARTKKPVWSYGEDLCASAGYWTGAQADEFRANGNASIGSIGVFAAVKDMSGAAEEMRIKVHVIKAGEYKGAGVPGTVITDQHLAEWQKSIDTIYGQFIDAVSAGRKMDRAKVEALADGRVHIGEEAVKLGLIDRVSSLDETLADLRDAVVAKTVSAPSPSKGSKAMSTETPAAPAVATLSQLKAACEGAPAEFLMSQLEGNATVEGAMKAWNAKLRADLEASNKATAAEKVRADEAAAKATAVPAKPQGVTPPKASETVADDSGSATDDFDAAVKAVMTRNPNMDRIQAVLSVAKKDPQLHQRFLMETNPKRQQQRLLQEKLDL